MHDLFSVLTLIVVVALVTTVVVNGKGAATVIAAFFKGFAGSLTAAQGR